MIPPVSVQVVRTMARLPVPDDPRIGPRHHAHQIRNERLTGSCRSQRHEPGIRLAPDQRTGDRAPCGRMRETENLGCRMNHSMRKMPSHDFLEGSHLIFLLPLSGEFPCAHLGLDAVKHRNVAWSGFGSGIVGDGDSCRSGIYRDASGTGCGGRISIRVIDWRPAASLIIP